MVEIKTGNESIIINDKEFKYDSLSVFNVSKCTVDESGKIVKDIIEFIANSEKRYLTREIKIKEDGKYIEDARNYHIRVGTSIFPDDKDLIPEANAHRRWVVEYYENGQVKRKKEEILNVVTEYKYSRGKKIIKQFLKDNLRKLQIKLPDGNIKTIEYYKENGDIEYSKHNRFRSSDHKLASSVTIDCTLNMTETKEFYRYDNEGRLILYKNERNGELNNKVEYSYDIGDRDHYIKFSKYIDYKPHKTIITEKTVYKKDKIISLDKFDKNGNLIQRKEYKYYNQNIYDILYRVTKESIYKLNNKSRDLELDTISTIYVSENFKISELNNLKDNIRYIYFYISDYDVFDVDHKYQYVSHFNFHNDKCIEAYCIDIPLSEKYNIKKYDSIEINSKDNGIITAYTNDNKEFKDYILQIIIDSLKENFGDAISEFIDTDKIDL